jgi:hypothetical protein
MQVAAVVVLVAQNQMQHITIREAALVDQV